MQIVLLQQRTAPTILFVFWQINTVKLQSGTQALKHYYCFHTAQT